MSAHHQNRVGKIGQNVIHETTERPDALLGFVDEDHLAGHAVAHGQAAQRGERHQRPAGACLQLRKLPREVVARGLQPSRRPDELHQGACDHHGHRGEPKAPENQNGDRAQDNHQAADRLQGDLRGLGPEQFEERYPQKHHRQGDAGHRRHDADQAMVQDRIQNIRVDFDVGHTRSARHRRRKVVEKPGRRGADQHILIEEAV